MISTEALKHFPYFAGIKESYLQKIAKISREVPFKPGEQLFREGNTATHFILVKSGEVHIVYRLGDDREIIADTLVAGDPAGWSSLLEPHSLTATGIANKEGLLIEIEAVELRRLCQENKDLGYVIMKEVAKVLRSRLSAMRVQAVTQVSAPM
jgi:CRP-like cAMP-binding protein